MGEAMESLVKITKSHIKTVLKDWIVTEEAADSCLVEIENIINSCSLTLFRCELKRFQITNTYSFSEGVIFPKL